jgi:hypothetical protein
MDGRVALVLGRHGVAFEITGAHVIEPKHEQVRRAVLVVRAFGDGQVHDVGWAPLGIQAHQNFDLPLARTRIELDPYVLRFAVLPGHVDGLDRRGQGLGNAGRQLRPGVIIAVGMATVAPIDAVEIGGATELLVLHAETLFQHAAKIGRPHSGPGRQFGGGQPGAGDRAGGRGRGERISRDEHRYSDEYPFMHGEIFL